MGFSVANSLVGTGLTNLSSIQLQRSIPLLGFRRRTTTFHVRASSAGGSRSSKSKAKAVTRTKRNPWNDGDDDTTQNGTSKPTSRRRSSASSPRKAKREQAKPARRTRQEASRILVSAVMPVEVEKVLQTEEPSTTPSWQTFVSSLCGVWRGVGAAFTPGTAEMEAIALGGQNEMLFDCRILSTVEEAKGTSMNEIHRKTVWAVGNPLGEQYGRNKAHAQSEEDSDQKLSEEGSDGEEGERDDMEFGLIEEIDDSKLQQSSGKRVTSDLQMQDTVYDAVMEEDVLQLEPGLVFFEDGSYSRGPLQLFSEEPDGSMSAAFKIEQCLVRGGHCRLRLVHTILVEGEGEEVQLLRVAVYHEEWMGPRNLKSISDMGGHHLRLFSQLPRLRPEELAGLWKVFEVSATAIIPEHVEVGSSGERPPYVYMSMEMEKRRLLPEVPIHFVDEDIMDMQDATVMWLPGGISTYVDVKEGGLLTIGVAWHDEGVNLVLERDYNAEGKLCEVHTKTEVKGGWVGGRM